MSTTFEHWKIDNLKNHHLNAEVFGQLSVDADCGEFVESVKRDGILQPLVVVPDGPKVQAGTVIAGHRRLQAAAKAGLKEVPVIVRRDLKTQLDIDRVWFETNRNREMTTEQKARWFKKRLEIESESAEIREKSGKANPVSNLTQGRAVDIAAKDVGLSRNTAKEAALVVDAIDIAEERGDTETAETLRKALNGKSVRAAAKAAGVVKPAKATVDLAESYIDDNHKEVPESLFPVWRERDTYMRICDDLKTLAGEIHELGKTPAGRGCSAIAREVDEAGKALALLMPSVVSGKSWKSIGDAK